MMPTMQEIDHAEKRTKEYSSALYVLLESIFSAARRGVEADQTIAIWQVEIRDRNETIANLKAELAALKVERDSMQAKIDALMMEYCPDEMTPEQVEEWGKHQKPSPDQGDSNER